MEENNRIRRYRIGEYARYMGVTPDLLKHYEEIGLICSERSENGYRYYPFYTSARLIECIRLRNYGMTLREIGNFFSQKSHEPERVTQRIEGNMQTLREEITLNELLIRDYMSFRDIEKRLEDRPWDWEIRGSGELCFLPHTNGYDFLQDERIYQILKEWMSCVPIVKSAMRVDPVSGNIWGFLVRKKDLGELKIPINDAVSLVSEQKVLLYYFRERILRLRDENFSNRSHPVLRLLERMNLKAHGPYYRICVMPSDWTKANEYQYGYYMVPIVQEGEEDRETGLL